MSVHAHLPIRLSEKKSRDPLASLDWPGASLLPAGLFKSELLWIPFDFRSKRSLLDKGIQPRLAQLKISDSVESSEFIMSAPPQDKGRVCKSTKQDNVLYVPFWLLSSMDNTRAWAAVEAFHGVIVAGDIAATPGAARMRLAVLLALALAAVALGFVMLFPAVHSVLYDYMGLNPVLAIIPGTVAVGILVWALRKTILPLFGEPLDRAIFLRLRLPVCRRWLRILKILSYVSAAFCVFLIPSLYKMDMYKSQYQPIHLSEHSFNITFGLNVLFFFTAAVLSVVAFISSRGGWLGSSVFATIRKFDLNDDKNEVVFVHAVFNVAVMVMAGMLFGQMFNELLNAIGEYTDRGFFMIRGAQLGALVGLHIGKLPSGARSVLTVGLVVEGLGAIFVGKWLLVGIVFTAVFLVELRRNMRKHRADWPSAFWDSARAAWGFVFGAILGRILGGVFGLFIFPIFSVGGLLAGTVLGVFIGATIGYISQRSDSTTTPFLSISSVVVPK